jgi:hypothetical protein
MSIEVKFRRGTSAEHSSFTGANGEITIDTTIKTLRVHDGVTVGGTRLAKFSDLGNAANLQSITTNVVPESNVSLDLGTAEKAWRDLYLSGNTITLGDSTISTDAGSIAFQDTDGQQVEISASTVKLGSGNTAIILGSSSGNLSINGGDVTLANVTITNLVLENVLGTEYGGTGLSSFTQNGVLFASNSSVLGFVTGTSGKVMQVGSNGTPEFNDLDGGNFT